MLVADMLSRDCLETESNSNDDTYDVHLLIPMYENALTEYKIEAENEP